MTAYLARVELKQADGTKATAAAYDRLHTEIEAIGLLRSVRSLADGLIYQLPHATYVGDCEREIDDMLADLQGTARRVVPDHEPRIVISACAEMRIGSLPRASRVRAALVQNSRFLVSC